MSEINDDLISKLIDALIAVTQSSTKSASIPTKLTKESKVEYEVIRADEILNLDGDTLPCLVDPIFPKQGLIGFAGSSDTGKSSLLKQLATSIARGESEFLGFPTNVKHRSVIYVSTEDDIHAVKVVLKKQRKKASRSNAVKGLRFLFNSEKLYKQVESELKREPADLVIIDALSDIVQGDMNMSSTIRPFLENFSNLSKKHECLIIFLHHTSKKSEGTVPKKGNLLGSQGFEAKCRMVSLLVRDNLEPQLRHFCIVKGNYLGDEYKDNSFVLDFMEDLTFKNTGERRPLDEIKQTENTYTKKKKLEQNKKDAVNLRSSGLTLQQIAEKLEVDKSTVSRWLDKSKVENKEVLEEVNKSYSLDEKLYEFIEKTKNYKSIDELREKYSNGNNKVRSQMRIQFKNFTKSSMKITDVAFAKLLGEMVQRNNNSNQNNK
jgi:RecA-family ATPase